MTTHRTDTAIKQDILDELKWDPKVTETEIGVTVKDGAVTLTGNVPLYSHKYAAHQAAKRIKGVRVIVDEVQVEIPSLMVGSDPDIAKHIAHIFEWNTQIPADKIKAEVKNGYVTVSGEVDWQYQRNYIQKLVEDVKGVRAVINSINIRKRAAVPDIRDAIVKALHRHAGVEADRIGILTFNGQVTLTGNVDSYLERDLIENAVWATPGVTEVLDYLNTPKTAAAA